MMRAGVKTEELAIQHMRHGGERVPVCRMAVRKHPNNAVPGKAAIDVRVFLNVNLVIVIDELVPCGLRKDEPCDDGEKNTYTDNMPSTERRRRRRVPLRFFTARAGHGASCCAMECLIDKV